MRWAGVSGSENPLRHCVRLTSELFRLCRYILHRNRIFATGSTTGISLPVFELIFVSSVGLGIASNGYCDSRPVTLRVDLTSGSNVRHSIQKHFFFSVFKASWLYPDAVSTIESINTIKRVTTPCRFCFIAVLMIVCLSAFSGGHY
jgi:hypothetical protein